MNVRLVLNLLGKALSVEGLLMLPSVAVSLIYGGTDWQALLASAVMAAAIGALLAKFLKPKNDNIRPREGFAAVALIWVFLSIFGGLPFLFSGAMDSFTDCFFECVSGFTTTGATILTNVETLPKGLLFWRSFTHWVGGMGVLALSLALIPHMGARAQNLLNAESTGPEPGKLLPRVSKSSKLLYELYLALSLVQVAALLLCGMNLYDAMIHMFGTAGTGGFSNYNASVGYFNSVSVDIVTATFMLLFGVSFTMYYYLLHGHWRMVLKNEELRAYLCIVAVAVVIITINIHPHTDSWGEALRQGYFQVSSIITTTGYATANFDLWPQISRGVLVILMLLGACAGSTGGGLKIVRLVMLLKAVGREVKHTIRPRSVYTIKMDGKPVEDSTVSKVLVFFFVYLLIIVLAAFLISVDDFSFETNLTAAISAVSNIGPGLGMVGPIGNFSAYSHFSKWVLSICMLIGRLEIYPIMMLFAPSIWRKN